MATAETLRASLLSSDEAHTLRSLVEALARQWTSNVHRCDDSSVVFAALRDIVAGAISNVAREWNSSHDVLRALPAEVQEQCFGSVPVPDRCRLSLVCSHWSTRVANLPGIWTRLDLERWKPRLGALLARSGQLPLDVSVGCHSDMRKWDDTLLSHSTRLRKLEIREISDDHDVVLGFAAPQLEELSIAMKSHSSSRVSHMLFGNHAPRLRTLRLASLWVPLACPTFPFITALTLRRTRGPLDHLFDYMPRLISLDINGHEGWNILPALPRNSSLRVLRLVDRFTSIQQLVRLGYSELDDLDVATTSGHTSHIVDAMIRWPTLPTTLRMRADWDFETFLQSDGRRMTFSGGCPTGYFDEDQTFPKLFIEGPRAFDQIVGLALPASLNAAPHYNSAESSRSRPVLLTRNDVVVLPALRTLVIECNNIRPSVVVHALREYVLGVFEVPRLARIEVLRAVEALRDAPIEPVDVADLLELVEEILTCYDCASLEVFVDTASGISLIGDVDRLRACVGKLVI